MSSGNDETKAFMMILSFIIAGLAMVAYIAAIIIAVGAAFLTVGLTLQCLWAWFTPRNYDGDILFPHQARSIIYCGLFTGVVSAFAVPIIFMIADHPLNFAEAFWPLAGIGYAIGVLLQGHDVQKANEAAQSRTQIIEQHSPPPSLPAPKPKVGKYASWDDEEEFGQ